MLLLGDINRRRLNPFESGQLGLDKFQPVIGERGNLLSRQTCKETILSKQTAHGVLLFSDPDPGSD
jgi:hypothetical protein